MAADCGPAARRKSGAMCKIEFWLVYGTDLRTDLRLSAPCSTTVKQHIKESY